MRYTLLKVTVKGVVLWDYHLRRLAPELGPGSQAQGPLIEFAKNAGPGVWALWADHGKGLRVERRPGSRLRDGMPFRMLPSPLSGDAGPFPKPSAPSIYDSVRVEGIATLLTSPGLVGEPEVYEACCAAVVAWDGSHIVCAPKDRARVWSTAEAAIREHLTAREALLPADSDALLLVNAVKGTCALAAPRSDGFPTMVRAEIEAVLEQLARRPHASEG
ncbi:MAG: hypothetical protein HY901_27010 [Deltaproteobacteria bacterium]|nr:hypothetical protein [Deltaproteobacteria bacterium]